MALELGSATIWQYRPAVEVRPLAPPEAPDAARALALAFQDDPVMSWCFPNADRRRRILGAGFLLFVNRVWLPERECFIADGVPGAVTADGVAGAVTADGVPAAVTADGVAGTACWLPPSRWHLPARRQLALLPSLVRIAGARTPRFLRLSALVESKHPAERPHWYLPALGVEPGSQGRGLGSRLMFPVLERCDRDGVPAHLEASTPRNRALYERHGFEVTEELQLPRGGPPIWLMWREPRG